MCLTAKKVPSPSSRSRKGSSSRIKENCARHVIQRNFVLAKTTSGIFRVVVRAVLFDVFIYLRV